MRCIAEISEGFDSLSGLLSDLRSAQDDAQQEVSRALKERDRLLSCLQSKDQNDDRMNGKDVVKCVLLSVNYFSDYLSCSKSNVCRIIYLECMWLTQVQYFSKIVHYFELATGVDAWVQRMESREVKC